MSLTLITDWQSAIWLDSITGISIGDLDSNGEPEGYLTLATALPCNLINTENYDEHTSAAGDVKADNLMTANRIRTAYGAPLTPKCIVTVTARTGVVYKYVVNGIAKQRAILGYTVWYCLPSGIPPSGLPGVIL